MGKSHTKDESIRKLADRITRVVKARGITVQRYDAYTTNSVYLKFDYGAANSVRISDHMGKRNVSNRFNLLKNIDRSYVELDRYLRYFYCTDDFDKLIADIIQNRNDQVEKYGPRHYEYLMKRNKAANTDTKGFWSTARIV
ncbi:hypothetical protein MHH60_31915 [Paenibacillus sp. FSL H7-0716]|uniref:Uncharacterized protein n=1 Tax=Paenibacillus odorifer TaxID=189426 RepID=A0AB36J3H9_9BACL|nr:hypothetical protein [Paenibacillus odorifer]OME10138.1 hypothetical protein BSK47_31175 [Paenibacillus odorifer]